MLREWVKKGEESLFCTEGIAAAKVLKFRIAQPIWVTLSNLAKGT
jgi:hypothetical protein